MKLQFTCPTCGLHRLDEVLENVTQFSTMIMELCDDDSLAIDYDDHYCENGDITRYQCTDCGYIIPDVSSEEELKEFLKK